MKKLFTFLIIFISLTVNAKAGPPIPLPKQEIIEAVKIVKIHFCKTFLKVKKVEKSKDFMAKDYLVTSIKYTKYFNEKKFKDYSWVIVLTHPISNDHSFTYQLKPNGNIVLLGETE